MCLKSVNSPEENNYLLSFATLNQSTSESHAVGNFFRSTKRYYQFCIYVMYRLLMCFDLSCSTVFTDVDAHAARGLRPSGWSYVFIQPTIRRTSQVAATNRRVRRRRFHAETKRSSPRSSQGLRTGVVRRPQVSVRFKL
jgi:hypothetical protein